MPSTKPPAELEKLQRAVRRALKKVPAFNRAELVFGEGPCPSDIMIVGEAPGRKETELKRPFVGRAGGFFRAVWNEVLKGPGEGFYITNVVKVWPRLETRRGRTRPPEKNEVAFFLPYLRKEVTAVRPKVVIAVGKTALGALAPGNVFKPGVWVEGPQGLVIMPVYHPAYILRKQKSLGRLTADLKAALSRVKRRLKLLRS